MNQRVLLQLDTATKDKVVSEYVNIQKENKGEYIIFFGQKDRLTITVYKNKRDNEFKAMFIGDDALKEAKRFDPNATANSKVKTKEKEKIPTKAAWTVLDEQIGSDEVGTGDFFGPICVCAAYIKKEDIKRLKKLGVDDSKRLSDDQIKEIAKVLIKEFEYSQLSLNNEKFNELTERNMNMNEIKARMHNQCLLNLKKKHPNVKHILVDEFAKENTYYSYLFGEKEIVENITFKTKGETYFPSVAVGSIIARYSFLQKMEQISKKLGMEVPFGASEKVTQFAQKVIKKFGKAELDKIVKKNFANYKKLS